MHPIMNPALWPHAPISNSQSSGSGEIDWTIVAVGVGIIAFVLLSYLFIVLKKLEATYYDE